MKRWETGTGYRMGESRFEQADRKPSRPSIFDRVVVSSAQRKAEISAHRKRARAFRESLKRHEGE